MTDYFLVIIAAALANNLVLEHLVGVSPAMAASRAMNTATNMSLAVMLLMPVTVISCYLLDVFLLSPLHVDFLQLPAFIFCITLVVLLAERILEKYHRALYDEIAVCFPLLLVNTALLGVVLLSVQAEHGLISSLLFAVGSGLGFGFTVIVFTALHRRIAASDTPAAFRGTAITFITLGILSMALMGFTGLTP